MIWLVVNLCGCSCSSHAGRCPLVIRVPECHVALLLMFWTTAVFFISGTTTLPRSIAVVSNGTDPVIPVLLWSRASLVCKNFLVDNDIDLARLPPEDGPCHVDWFHGNSQLCQTQEGRCQCIGARRFARHGGVFLVITRVTQKLSGKYTCQYPSAALAEHLRSHQSFQLTVDASMLL